MSTGFVLLIKTVNRINLIFILKILYQSLDWKYEKSIIWEHGKTTELYIKLRYQHQWEFE